MSTTRYSGFITTGLLLLAAFACDPWLAYSPYEISLDQVYERTTEQHLERISARSVNDTKPFRIALLSDAHYHFNGLNDALTHINQSDDFDFVVVLGDLTDNGLLQEYVYFHQSMAQLKIPYLSVIGNHDYLSNGGQIYDRMFGPNNYTFVYNNVKFILFDNVRWESNKVPDFDWLERELVNDHGYDHIIPLSHIPPYDGQMEAYRDRFHTLLVKNGISTSFHGHRHTFSIEEYPDDGLRYVTVSSPQYRAYTALTIGAELTVEKIEY